MRTLATQLRRLADKYEELAENAEDRGDRVLSLRWEAKADALYMAASMAEKVRA